MLFPRNKSAWQFLTFFASCIFLFAGCSSAHSAVTKHADKVIIEKSNHTMTLMSGQEILKSYKVALGGQPLGAKDRQGDHETPEGLYCVGRKNPNSTFHRALHLTHYKKGMRHRDQSKHPSAVYPRAAWRFASHV
jgi:L,D-transpeptidase catalytic domain